MSAVPTSHLPIHLPGKLTEVSLELPEQLSYPKWEEIGQDCPDFEFLRGEFKIPDRGYRSEAKLDVRIEDMEFENDEDAT